MEIYLALTSNPLEVKDMLILSTDGNANEETLNLISLKSLWDICSWNNSLIYSTNTHRTVCVFTVKITKSQRHKWCNLPVKNKGTMYPHVQNKGSSFGMLHTVVLGHAVHWLNHILPSVRTFKLKLVLYPWSSTSTRKDMFLDEA